MDNRISEILEENAGKFNNKEIDSTQMLKKVEEFFDQCTDFDDVEKLISYCLYDESGAGIVVAKSLAQRAVTQRAQGKIGPTDRFGKSVSQAVENLILAKSFAQYATPHDKNEFMMYFNKANELASDSFDYRLLAGRLYEACRDIGDPTIDPDFVRTKTLMQRAVDLSVQENSLPGLEDMESMAKTQINDKDYAKSITALKKKVKKANQ